MQNSSVTNEVKKRPYRSRKEFFEGTGHFANKIDGRMVFSSNLDKFFNDVRRVRAERGLSLKAVANRTGTTDANLCRYEKNKAHSVHADTFLLICREMNLNPMDYVATYVRTV